MIAIYTGLQGAGKSLKLAKVITDLLWRNFKYYKKSGKIRALYSNLHLAEFVEQLYPGFIKYWSDPSELVKIRDADVIWDEIATHLDSTQWQNMPLELKRWLQQHRKYGIEVYGTTQDFAMIDKSMRRLTSDLFYLKKIIGSRDKSSTMPEVKRVWGLIMSRELDPTIYDEDKTKNKPKGIPMFMFITKDRVAVFDTTQEIKMGKYPPLRHIARDCEDDNCQFHKIIHV